MNSKSVQSTSFDDVMMLDDTLKNDENVNVKIKL